MLKLGIKTAIIGNLFCLIFIFTFIWHLYGTGPFEFTNNLAANLTSGGTSATVLENPYNALAKQLTQKEQDLNEREEALALMIDQVEEENQKLINFIFGLIGLLFVLLISNFYLDFRSHN